MDDNNENNKLEEGSWEATVKRLTAMSSSLGSYKEESLRVKRMAGVLMANNSQSFMKTYELVARIQSMTASTAGLSNIIGRVNVLGGALNSAQSGYAWSSLSSKSIELVRKVNGAMDRESERLRACATPIMKIWEVAIMLMPPPFSADDRRDFAKGVLFAIEQWGMRVFAYPSMLNDSAFFNHLSYENKLSTKIHIDEFSRYAIEGKIAHEAVEWLRLWEKFIGRHEAVIVIPKLVNSLVAKAVIPRKKRASDSHAKWIARAIDLWEHWDDGESPHRLEKKGVDRIYKIIAGEVFKAKSTVADIVREPLEKYIKNRTV